MEDPGFDLQLWKKSKKGKLGRLRLGGTEKREKEIKKEDLKNEKGEMKKHEQLENSCAFFK